MWADDFEPEPFKEVGIDQGHPNIANTKHTHVCPKYLKKYHRPYFRNSPGNEAEL